MRFPYRTLRWRTLALGLLLAMMNLTTVGQADRGLSQVAESQTPSTKGAVVVGISRYQHEQSYPRLKGASFDAAAFERFLKTPAGGSFNDNEITFLTDDEASIDAISGAVERQLARLKGERDHATFYFFYAGHGVAGALCPYGAVANDGRTELGYQWLGEQVRAAGIKTPVFVLDACQAGSFITAQREAVTSEGAAMQKRLEEVAAATRGLTVFMAVDATTGAADLRDGGLYTNTLMDGLTSLDHCADTDPADGIITAGELHDYLVQRLGRSARRPVFHGNRATPIGSRPRGAAGVVEAKKPSEISVDSAVKLGAFYFDRKEYDRARPYVERCATAGKSDAQFRLGWMYATGRGVPKDDGQAVASFRKAVTQGNAKAQFGLGVMYYNGRGVAQDEGQAVTWFRKAAEQGDADSQFNLGWMYANGRGVAKDEAQAVTWYRKAAEQGNTENQCWLGWMYESGWGVAKDESQAVAWYYKAAEQGNAVAQFKMGVMYANGRGVARDDIQAVEWYRKAAEQGDAFAQSNLGVMYAKGRGVTRDEVQAGAWYRKAAEQGDADARNNLGVMYENGRGGLPRDRAQATSLYRQAAAQGSEAAKANLRRLGKQE